MNEFKNPYLSTETNLDVAIGTIAFQDRTIKNLRVQISALRNSLINYGMVEKSIDNIQYAHLKEANND